MGWRAHHRGFQEGRQFGRGKHGGQVRDEYRTDYDPGRGGYGKLVESGLNQLSQRPQGEGALGPLGRWSSGAADDGRGFKRGRESDGFADAEKRARESTAEKNPRFRGEERGDEDE